MKKIIYILFIVIVIAQPKYNEISGKAGSFARMGFGPRGMGMGNAMTAVNTGQISSYYNPALTLYQEDNSVQAAYSFLSLDRKLNFLSFTKKFVFKSRVPTDYERSAAISVGLINSGVGNIDQYNYSGEKTGSMSTSENMFYLSLGTRFSKKFTIGVTFKYYYYKLVENLDAKGYGFDIAAVYALNDDLSVGFGFYDVNAKYEWDSSTKLGQDGRKRVDSFPLMKRLGIAYKMLDKKLILATDFENSNAGTNYIRIGSEYNLYENLYVRGGLDRINLSNSDEPIRPSMGFSYFYKLDDIKIGINYAFVIEPYSSYDQHIIGLNFNF